MAHEGSGFGVTLWHMLTGEDRLQKICDVGQYETTVKRCEHHIHQALLDEG